MKPLYRFLTVLSLLFTACRLHAQNPLPPKYEVRAVWLTTIGGLDWPHSYAQSSYSAEKQKDELRNILDKLQKAGINTVLIQTRIRGTVIYPSAYEPWDGCLSGFPGKSPGYDALQFAIDECHKRGMELHAWVVTIPVGKWNALGCSQLRKKLPGLIRKIGPDGYMNPENPKTGAYLADICQEITRNYDIDGIHLDYIRYPETWNIKVGAHEGRRNITRIVEDIHRKVKALKPWVKMSCSPVGKFSDLSRYRSQGWNAYARVCQDVQGWLRDGLMDEIFPMMYFQGQQFYPFAIDWAESSYGRIVVPGLGIYFMSPHEKNWPLNIITRELEVLRRYKLGHTYFRSKFFTDNTKGIYDFASREFTPYPALVPPMTWEHATAPTAPGQLKAEGTLLSWLPAQSSGRQGSLAYNVYSSTAYPVNTADARNLVRIRMPQCAIRIPEYDGTRYYAVTTTDRFGNESPATQLARPAKAATATGRNILKCDGQHVELPAKNENMDADLITIETLQGSIVASRSYQGRTADVRSLPEGIYIIRSLNSKGVAHKLGICQIKRRTLQSLP
ncbi:Uncharacterized lipoprotein YddW, UPF0748 family [Prevotellaceae bacterium KH2P17]|nr:Uncharacterized lipoprotein YddW, UPF0748 family [Prevotellaceae bacterium KH2P17]